MRWHGESPCVHGSRLLLGGLSLLAVLDSAGLLLAGFRSWGISPSCAIALA